MYSRTELICVFGRQYEIISLGLYFLVDIDALFVRGEKWLKMLNAWHRKTIFQSLLVIFIAIPRFHWDNLAARHGTMDEKNAEFDRPYAGNEDMMNMV